MIILNYSFRWYYSELFLLKLWLFWIIIWLVFWKSTTARLESLVSFIFKLTNFWYFGDREIEAEKYEPLYWSPTEKWFQTKEIYLSLPSSFKSPFTFQNIFHYSRKPCCSTFDLQIWIRQLDSELCMCGFWGQVSQQCQLLGTSIIKIAHNVNIKQSTMSTMSTIENQQC